MTFHLRVNFFGMRYLQSTHSDMGVVPQCGALLSLKNEIRRLYPNNPMLEPFFCVNGWKGRRITSDSEIFRAVIEAKQNRADSIDVFLDFPELNPGSNNPLADLFRLSTNDVSEDLTIYQTDNAEVREEKIRKKMESARAHSRLPWDHQPWEQDVPQSITITRVVNTDQLEKELEEISDKVARTEKSQSDCNNRLSLLADGEFPILSSEVVNLESRVSQFEKEISIVKEQMKLLKSELATENQKAEQKVEKKDDRVPFRHTASCDVCDELIIGHRFKCLMCADYDLCSRCESEGHHENHALMRIVHPDKTMVPGRLRKYWSRGFRVDKLKADVANYAEKSEKSNQYQTKSEPSKKSGKEAPLPKQNNDSMKNVKNAQNSSVNMFNSIWDKYDNILHKFNGFSLETDPTFSSDMALSDIVQSVTSFGALPSLPPIEELTLSLADRIRGSDIYNPDLPSYIDTPAMSEAISSMLQIINGVHPYPEQPPPSTQANPQAAGDRSTHETPEKPKKPQNKVTTVAQESTEEVKKTAEVVQSPYPPNVVSRTVPAPVSPKPASPPTPPDQQVDEYSQRSGFMDPLGGLSCSRNFDMRADEQAEEPSDLVTEEEMPSFQRCESNASSISSDDSLSSSFENLSDCDQSGTSQVEEALRSESVEIFESDEAPSTTSGAEKDENEWTITSVTEFEDAQVQAILSNDDVHTACPPTPEPQAFQERVAADNAENGDDGLHTACPPTPEPQHPPVSDKDKVKADKTAGTLLDMGFSFSQIIEAFNLVGYEEDACINALLSLQ